MSYHCHTPNCPHGNRCGCFCNECSEKSRDLFAKWSREAEIHRAVQLLKSHGYIVEKKEDEKESSTDCR